MYIIILILLFRYKYCRKPSDDWRHETLCHGYLLLLITSYIQYIALFYIILSTLPEIVNNLWYSYILVYIYGYIYIIKKQYYLFYWITYLWTRTIQWLRNIVPKYICMENTFEFWWFTAFICSKVIFIYRYSK